MVEKHTTNIRTLPFWERRDEVYSNFMEVVFLSGGKSARLREETVIYAKPTTPISGVGFGAGYFSSQLCVASELF